jgi:hypothetical protein
MRTDSFGTLSGDDFRRQAIVDWWTELSRSGDAGCSSWEVLDSIQDHVTAALALGPSGLNEAEHFTAEAILRVSGQIEI